MHVGNYVGLVHGSEQQLADAFASVAKHHIDEPDVHETCLRLASWSKRHVETLKPLVDRYSEEKSAEPQALSKALFHGPRAGGLGLLRDLHDIWLLAGEVDLCWMVLGQAAKALRDRELESACSTLEAETRRQMSWLLTRIKQAAPQALVVAD